MNQYERFFRLLWTLMGMILEGKATIEWLGDCFQAIIESPTVPQVILPVRSKPAGERYAVKAFKLEVVDWERLAQFCKNHAPRFQPLVEYYKRNDNKPTSCRDLRRLGLLTTQPGTFGPMLNKAMRDAGFSSYGFKGNHGGNFEDKLMRFVIMA